MHHLSFDAAARLCVAVHTLTMDRQNNTHGPGHYLTSAWAAVVDAYNREHGTRLVRMTIQDYQPIVEPSRR